MSHKKALSDREIQDLADNLSDISVDGCENDEDLLDEEMEDIPDFTTDKFEAQDTYNAQENRDESDFNIENMPILFEADNILLESLEVNNTTVLTPNNCPQSFNSKPVINSPQADLDNSQNITPRRTVRFKRVITPTAESTSSSNNQDGNLKQNVHINVPKNLVWTKENINFPQELLEFKGSTTLPTDIMDLSTPYSFFKFFFTDNIIDNIVVQSNLYSTQQNANKPANLTADEIRKFIGICFYMSIVTISNIRKYWSEKIGYQKIIDTMPVRQFERIRQFLHFNDNTSFCKEDKSHDRMHKIRPLMEALRTNFQKLPCEIYLSVDEQLCATKARHFLLQYIPMKPHKWGFKFFVLSGVSGYTYDFEIYTGQENDVSKRQDCEPNIGASSNVVIRLLRNVPKQINHQVYFDNYYTSLPLLAYLEKNGFHCVGTARRNRIPNCPLPTEQDLKKENRRFLRNYY